MTTEPNNKTPPPSTATDAEQLADFLRAHARDLISAEWDEENEAATRCADAANLLILAQSQVATLTQERDARDDKLRSLAGKARSYQRIGDTEGASTWSSGLGKIAADLDALTTQSQENSQ